VFIHTFIPVFTPAYWYVWCLQIVGPILAEPAQPLPSDLSSFLDEGTAQGLAAVYVCMGSAGRLTQTQLHSMAQGLSALPNPVLWKLSKIDLPGEVNKTCC